ncbi:hypothetical protein [Bacillus cereus]|uniref:hypothetical protein n=1 Tax=Bacillus cereus TaxID=1396 RepID=UPI000BF7968B|nr:hypothetical protein [Bacillus cereus]PFB64424.1 hypothetical protein CN291_17230 [Bacillus cereus]
MKTTNKLELMLDVIEKADKNALVNLVMGMSQNEITRMAKSVPAIRSSLQYAYAEAEQTAPKYTVKKDEFGTTFAFEYQPRNNLKRNEKIEQILEKQQQEISEKYGDRAATPKSEFIKCNSHEELFDLIMKDKKEKGWSFKDE